MSQQPDTRPQDPTVIPGQNSQRSQVPGLSTDEFAHLVEACHALPLQKGTYLEKDFVTNVLLSVVDYQMRTPAVVRAMDYYKAHRKSELRSIDDLASVLQRFPDDKEGNTVLAQHLWGYNLWTRAHQLRGLVQYFEAWPVRNQEELIEWAKSSTFDDFAGQVKGLGRAVYNFLVMRQGIDIVKPDVHVLRFVRSDVGRPVPETVAVNALIAIAKLLDIRAYELDWRIWEHEYSASGGKL